MPKKRRIHSANFKAQIALEAARELNNTSELASKHQVHPTQINQWKKRLLSGAADLFTSHDSKQSPDQDTLTAPLYEEIGSPSSSVIYN